MIDFVWKSHTKFCFLTKLLLFSQLSIGIALLPIAGSDYFPPTMSILCHSDFCHVSTIIMTMHLNMFYGCTTYILRNHIALEKMLGAIQDCRINAIMTPAWSVALMIKTPAIEQYDLSSLKVILTFGSAIGKEMCMLFYQRFKVLVMSGYGTTEALGCFNAEPQSAMSGKLAFMQTKLFIIIALLTYIYRRSRWIGGWVLV